MSNQKKIAENGWLIEMIKVETNCGAQVAYDVML
jgi:hypothetical protein